MPKHVIIKGQHPNQVVVQPTAGVVQPQTVVVQTPAALVIHHAPPVTHAHALHVAHGKIHKPPHKHRQVTHMRTLVAPTAAQAPMLVQYAQHVAPPLPVTPTTAAQPQSGAVTHTRRFVQH